MSHHSWNKNAKASRCIVLIAIVLSILIACQTTQPPKLDPQQALIAKGRDIFFNETFNGNGRTCGTCHPAENNFTIDKKFIATLPDDDPLFVAEFLPELKNDFEKPPLMRGFGLILENLDGFDDLPNVFNMRGVPFTLALNTSIESRDGPRLGWSGDGSPLDGSLRAFAIGAVIQHFTLTTDRIPGVDFRLPTEEELDALEAFQASLGRQQELELPLPLKSSLATRGQEIFNDAASGKCFGCHVNAGANGSPVIFGEGAGNLNFDTGVEVLPDQPADLSGEFVPPDDGFGTPGDGTFNTPSIVEAADTGPFFHNNSIDTIEGAVAFYNGDSFNNSPAGQLLINATGSGINLDATQTQAVAAFLRVINALENIRQSLELLNAASGNGVVPGLTANEARRLAIEEIRDSIIVLQGAGLHPDAVAELKTAEKFAIRKLTVQAIAALKRGRDHLVESS